MLLGLSYHGTTTLGNLINGIKQAPDDADVMFDFAHTIPDGVRSWRGDYSQLAIGWKPQQAGDFPNAKLMSEILEMANGNTYEGYKGGDFKMDLSTPIWIDNYGEYTSTAIVGLQLHGDSRLIIQTNYVE